MRKPADEHNPRPSMPSGPYPKTIAEWEAWAVEWLRYHNALMRVYECMMHDARQEQRELMGLCAFLGFMCLVSVGYVVWAIAAGGY